MYCFLSNSEGLQRHSGISVDWNKWNKYQSLEVHEGK